MYVSDADNINAWPTKDLGTALAMLNDLPDSMFPVEEGSRFVHINADNNKGYKMIAESLIQVYSGWHNLDENQKTTSLSHEVGHLFAHGRWDKPEWIELSGWTSRKEIVDGKEKTIWTMGRPETAVLEYAKTNPNEDFGESFFMYRYNGAQMKERFPEKYEYMKNNVFNGSEFISSTSCE